ncbi:MAG: hypothetical protein GY948_02385 [Alphaproteobacteria bacterium]|nr:hypothetical protein [Alphaproteobacteria bacterium]
MRIFDAITFGAALAVLAMVGLYVLSPTLGLTLTPTVGFTICGLALLLGAGWALLYPGFLRTQLKQH